MPSQRSRWKISLSTSIPSPATQDPTTGFKGAEFTLELSNASATDYDWKANASWVSVSDGVVSFTGTGTKDKVTITGTPKSGGTAITYSFTLSSWYCSGILDLAT
ncbi:hypothetical protein MUN35_20210 [Hafnia paralvei]|uniref:hypothetical protein n=1 Tax=Hafnia paralvei TaxID=546367 RepID=UPI001FFF065B|nr:hypothetical protein [Hafnia paralvei]MCK2182012.1 hypothetical protein [Hafnia paralvei]